MKRLICVALVMLGCFATTSGIAGGQFEYVVFGMGGSRWDGGVMKWYYNHQGAPSGISESDALTTLKKAAAKWSNGCKFQFQYQGTTTTATWVKDGTTVVGWQSAFGEAGTTYSIYTDTRIKEGDIRFNSDSVTSLTTLEAVATHEFGHALGLDHSNQPDSIMYANPYHTTRDQLTLKYDDMTACQALYGASGLAATEKYSAPSSVTLTSTEKVDVYVTTTAPDVNNPPTSSLASISSSTGKVYFSAFFRGITVGQTLRLDTVAPDGTLYDSSSTTASYSNGYWGSSRTWSSVGAAAIPGTWTVYFWQGDVLKGKTQFTNVSTYDQPVMPEVVMIGKLSAGKFSYSLTNLTPSRSIEQYAWSFDGATSTTTAAPTISFSSGTTHTAQVAVRGTKGHYDNQSSGAADYLMQQSVPVSFSGTLAAASFSGLSTGGREALTLHATVAIPSSESGSKNVYVVAQVGSSMFFKTAGGWAPLEAGIQPLFSTTAPAVATFNVLDAMNVTGLPSGTVIYAGYGDNLDQVVQKSTFGKVLTLQ